MKRKDALWVMQMCRDRDARSEAEREAFDTAIEALKREQPDEWCTDCKEYDTEKKCCPRFNKVIREAMKRVPHDDGTLEVKVEDATKVGRVLISDDKHRGGLYYPDEDEPQGDLISRTETYRRITELSRDLLNDDCINLGNASEYLRIIRELPSADRPTDGDLISRADAIDALGEEPPVWCDDDAEIAERNQWRADIEAIKSVPSADRPRPIDPTCAVDPESGVVPISACEPRGPKTIIYADRPRGEWADMNGNPVPLNEDGETANSCWCSECGEWLVASDEYPTRGNFCPNCGADMRGGEAT